MWTVTGIGDEGALHVKHVRRPASAVLPAGNVSEDVVLGYATTIAGAKGRTVDRGHVVVTPRTASASLYVGMSPGRDSNHAHVVCDFLRIGWPRSVVHDLDGAQRRLYAVREHAPLDVTDPSTMRGGRRSRVLALSPATSNESPG